MRQTTMEELAVRAKALRRQWEAMLSDPGNRGLGHYEFREMYDQFLKVEKDLGKTLAYARRQVPRGGWGKWLATTGVPASSARKLIKRRNDP